ncbi:MAG: Peptidoglycan-associated outer membrane protein [Candidatus Magasanikbacteria bacterium GW2011_GWA2_40_10]|uniref:Peptidoglycan-associated outer membrane protein n=1 Tax=Candidatus Magasanikbacteria bacterium GW2011_GWA2_40_10 TaxID=1619037 RepID=A0A0G0Q2W6_9BACT|nr:MAG: Peptidoglycan-associated outer membrane protein [Candidatus Magasanikbacteria bacterium GW2011_GWA2_40_10]
MPIIKKITILLVILALIGMGALAYRKFYLSKQADNKTVTVPVDTSVDKVKQREFNDAIKKISASDQDLDGVSDSDEAKYKTSPTSSDTDEDGLTDWQEIFNFKTDPLKADTDGDGLADGSEVRRGTNPSVKQK